MHDANASASNASNEASRLQQIAEEKEAAKSKSSMAAQKLFQNAESTFPWILQIHINNLQYSIYEKYILS